MIVPTMAFRNLRRNRRRTILTATVVALGSGVLFFVTAFSNGSYDEFLKLLAHTVTGDIRLRNTEYEKKERMLPVDLTIPLSLEQVALAQPGVVKVLPRTTFGTMLWNGDKSKEAMGLGLDPDKERDILALQGHLIEGSYFSSATAAEAVVCWKLAEALGLHVGDEITLLTNTSFGSMGTLNLKVVGISRLGVYMYDDVYFFLPHKRVESLLDNADQTTELLAFMDPLHRQNAPAIADAITAPVEGVETTAWQNDKMMAMVIMQRDSTDIILKMIIVFITAVTIFNTMLVSVMERFGEFGVLKALGLRDNKTLQLVLMEGLLIGIFGSLAGILLFLYPTWYFQKYGWDIAEMMEGFNMPAQTVWRARITMDVIATSIITGTSGAILASIPPALRARRMEPVEALRKIRA